ncbi:nuclear factor of activated T-cells, cytoplasmic 1-like protein [Lates japonicus]|uniref:Nuclear factor of activated T-cells, cytoplasmic 1-like protein n=1 Tax=Lates japonicus TaxID=270547 RepID=A0AAD3MGY2_LATJO|nr:nuclear factor of activated T-cells, cytoplasmic 1-like protein [Lates japonicus]
MKSRFLSSTRVAHLSDGHHLWETEAKVERDASKANSLLVEIPPYRNQRLSTPVHVNFYVCNGKRKRSQYQRFTYVPASGSRERGGRISTDSGKQEANGRRNRYAMLEFVRWALAKLVLAGGILTGRAEQAWCCSSAGDSQWRGVLLAEVTTAVAMLHVTLCFLTV